MLTSAPKRRMSDSSGSGSASSQTTRYAPQSGQKRPMVFVKTVLLKKDVSDRIVRAPQFVDKDFFQRQRHRVHEQRFALPQP